MDILKSSIDIFEILKSFRRFLEIFKTEMDIFGDFSGDFQTFVVIFGDFLGILDIFCEIFLEILGLILDLLELRVRWRRDEGKDLPDREWASSRRCPCKLAPKPQPFDERSIVSVNKNISD